MATGVRVDPYKDFRFLVEIDGIVQAGFSECSGFGSDVEVVDYREGGDSATVRKLPGKTSYPDITLKWGLTDSRDLYDWHRAAVNGAVERKNGLDHPAGRPRHREGPLELLSRVAEQMGRRVVERHRQRGRDRDPDGHVRATRARLGVRA
jgi:hypothetical protein